MSSEILVGEVTDFADGARHLVDVDGRTIGVFSHHDKFYAFLNRCPHQGGPVCEGVIKGKVEVDVDPEGGVGLSSFSETEIHIACPWHGVEYDIETGRCWSDKRLRLRSYEVAVRGNEVFLVL